jgi:biotin-dependent carboxylase uncharacterized domain
MEMKIVRPGMLTTVQDLGRRGWRRAGVPASGAMDAVALRVANALVGNAEGAAALEFTLTAPEVEFSEDAWVAVGGAECAEMAAWQPRRVKAGERLRIGACVKGCRGYLAVAGGIAVEPVLGSRSTFLRGRLGGLEGRALKEGDVLAIGAGEGRRLTDEAMRGWRIDPRVLPAYSTEPTVRVVLGAQAADYGAALLEAWFTVSAQSDRMGFRLQGAKLERSGAEELLSSAVSPGTVQVPPDGQPVVLMADAQTIGGYPQAAHVITVDLPLVAQLRPGDRMRFSEVALGEAHRLAFAREKQLAILREGLAQKLNHG